MFLCNLWYLPKWHQLGRCYLLKWHLGCSEGRKGAQRQWKLEWSLKQRLEFPCLAPLYLEQRRFGWISFERLPFGQIQLAGQFGWQFLMMAQHLDPPRNFRWGWRFAVGGNWGVLSLKHVWLGFYLRGVFSAKELVVVVFCAFHLSFYFIN